MPRKEELKEVLGLNRITKKRILELCKKNKLYQTPELNDVLYLHYQGFECIEGLEDYTELKCLWLECNAISEIQGLENQTKLKCLFLQSNLIRKMKNLQFCKELDTINLSQNHIRKIENCGFDVLPMLNTLNLSSNYLKDCEGLKELEKCKNLSVLDLSNNRIDDILVVKIFSRMPELKVLVLQGNPVVSKIPQYRKTLILECNKLTYLDSRPVFPKDRACAEAWKRGGYEEERRENERWNRKERKKMRDGVNATIQLRNKNRKAEDQVSLIPSSDSEDDLNMQTKNLEISFKSDASIDPIWNEVSEDKASEKFLISNIICRTNTNESCYSCESVNNDMIHKENNETIKVEQKQEDEKRQEVEEEDENLNTNITDKSSEVKRSNSNNSLNSNIDSQEKYQPIVEAIEKISTSVNNSEYYAKNNTDNVSENNEHDEDNYQSLKDLEETMNIFLNYECEEHSSSQQPTKTKLKNLIPKLEKEDERSKINQQLITDFEELSNNMSDFVKKLDKDQTERQEVIKALFDKNTAAKESCSGSSDSDKNDQWNRESKLENVISKNTVSQIMLNNNSYNNVKIEKVKATTLNKNVRDKILDDDSNENIESINTNIKKCHQAQCNEFAVVSNFEGLSECSIRDNFMYVPMDISLLTHKSNEALKSLETESKELKRLLQELENKNEDFFKDINVNQKFHIEEIRENKENVCVEDTMIQNINCENMPLIYESFNKIYNDIDAQDNIEVMNEKEHKQVVYTIVHEILESVEQKLFDTIEFPNKSELSPQPQKQIISESLPEILNSFNQIFKSDKTQQKSLILKELSKQSNLKQFNNDTHENLDAQLEKFKRDKSIKVRRMVNRVYAQKDLYNDTLEFVDDKLMVRNNDTNDLQHLPKSNRQDSNDSESDYDTAQSDAEEKSDEYEKIKKLQEKKRYKRISFKPTPRKSSEDIIIKALVENNSNRSNDNAEESIDEFYSLDADDNLYNIDKEFFNKLTFDNINLSQTDENHIVQCAKSYEELKHCLTLSKEERCLSKEENVLLESLNEGKCTKIEENSENLPKTLNSHINLNEEKRSNETVNDIYFGNQLEEKILWNTNNDRTTDWKISTEKDENKLKKLFLKKLTANKEFFPRGKDNNKKINHKTFSVVERLNDEEKNEFENNIDFESAAVNVKLDCQANRELIKEKFQTGEAEQKTEPEVNINEEHSDDSDNNGDSCGIDVLECNLEIFGINDELMETITVNAELKF